MFGPHSRPRSRPSQAWRGQVVMWEAMVRMDMARRLKAHRALSLGLCSLALVGWGACAYAVGSSAGTQRDLRAELAHLRASQDQLLAEKTQHQAAVGDLAQLQAQIASARAELQALAKQREHANTQAAGHQDRAGLTKVLEGQTKGSKKERVAKPASKPAKVAAQT